MFKRQVIGAIIVLTLAASASVAQKISKESIVYNDKKHSYYIYVPKLVEPNKPAPMVLLFHGSNRNGLSLAEKWKELADREGVIIVAPDSLNAAEWSVPRDGPAFLEQLVESLKGKHSINPRRVYLFGHSGGAIFALLMALYESEYFAAAAVHAGALYASATVVLDQAKRKTPMQLQVGSKDGLFPVTVVRATRDALQSRGFPVELVEIAGHDHWYYDLAPKINQDAWEFLKAHELPTDPRFEQYTFRTDSPRSQEATGHYAKGITRHRANDLAGALVEYTRAIESDPKFADAYNNRGIVYSTQQNAAAAIADFTRSIEITPSVAAYNNRANVYISQKKVPEAISDFSAAIKLGPSAEAHVNRGTLYWQTSQESLALQDFERAIELDPKLGRAYVLRGIALLKSGKADAAQKDFDKGFSLAPDLHGEFAPIIRQMQPRP